METDHAIDARSIVTLIVFILVNVLVIAPLPIPYFYPRKSRREGESRWERRTFYLGLEVAPVVGVLLLLASTCIPGKVVREGIVGSEGVKPYDIMTLFLCFAYISLSLDATGLLRYLAFVVGNKYSSSGSRLHFAFYVFFAVVGLLVGNDPLILSGTPFLVYFTGHASITHPQGYLHTHFQVANLVSALLVSSNPTNLVLTSAFKISFLQYSAWTALPTVGAVIILYPVLRYWIFNHPDLIPPRLSPPHVDASQALHDKWGGIFGSTLFLITIFLLVGLSAGHKLEAHPWSGVWIVVLPAALLMFAWDSIGDLRDPGRRERANKAEVQVKETHKPGQDTLEMGKMERTDETRSEVASPVSGESQEKVDQSTEPRQPVLSEKVAAEQPEPAADMSSAAETEKVSKPVQASAKDQSHPDQVLSTESTRHSDADTTLDASRPKTPITDPPASPEFSLFDIPPFSIFARHFPTPAYTFKRMPWNLVPFAFSMFILVEALQYTGWIRVFGKWWTAWVKVDSTGVAGSVWLMGVLSVIGCNVFGTNIGATILLSRVLQYWQQNSGPVPKRTLYGAVYALAVGSNFGAYSYVFSASLAGLLWKTILAQKDRTVTLRDFVKYNWAPVLITMVVGCLIVAGEVCVIYKD